MRVERMFSMAHCYLVHGDEGAVLVDTGSARQRERILRRAREAGVRLIVLTHAHADHAANAAFLSEALGVPVGMHPGDAPRIHGGETEAMHAHNPFGKVIIRISRWMDQHAALIPFEVGVWLSDGDSLKAYGVDADIIALPGHTPGSIGVLAGEDILVGDAMMHYVAVTGALLYEDREQMQASVERIYASGATRIHVGHGPVIHCG